LFFSTSGFHAAEFSDFSTTTGMVRGCSALYIRASRLSKEVSVYVAMSKPLFAWDCLQDSPSLGVIKQFLASIPDGRLLQGLRQHRGRGRNDCPVQIAWGVLLLRIALRHVSIEATRAQ
jgi:hypothetical protein